MQFLGSAPSNPSDLVTKSYADGLSVGGSTPSGMLPPVDLHTDGSETYTISGGSVTAISGPQIQSRTVNVGDRILVITAPASSGTGSSFNRTSQPANGVYVATAVGSTISVSRAADFSGSVQPAGLSVYSANTSGNWLKNAVFVVQFPNDIGFTFGTDNVYFVAVAGADLNPNNLFINSNKLGFWNSTASISTWINLNPNTAGGSGDQNLYLPAVLDGTLLARVVVSVTGSLTFANAAGTEYVYLLKSGAIPTLPTAVANKAFYRVKNTTAAPITVLSAGGTIDDSTSISLRPGVSVDIVSDGTNYFVI